MPTSNTSKPPIRLSDKSVLESALQPDDLLIGLRMGEADAALRNKKWTAQSILDFVQDSGVGGLAPRVALTSTQARNLASAGKLTPGQPYAIDLGSSLLLLAASDASSFEVFGELITPGAPATHQLVIADLVADTYTPLLDGVKGGAPQWVAGPQKAGSLVYNDSSVWRVKVDIANSQVAPTQAAGSTQHYEFVGGPAVLTALAQVATNTANIGTVGQLTTTAKILVPAINEVRALYTALKAYSTFTATTASRTDGYMTPAGVLDATGFMARVLTSTGNLTAYATHQNAVLAAGPGDYVFLAGYTSSLTFTGSATYFCYGLTVSNANVGQFSASPAASAATVYGLTWLNRLIINGAASDYSTHRCIDFRGGPAAYVALNVSGIVTQFSSPPTNSVVFERLRLRYTPAYQARTATDNFGFAGGGLFRWPSNVASAASTSVWNSQYGISLMLKDCTLENVSGPLFSGSQYNNATNAVHLQGSTTLSFGTAVSEWIKPSDQTALAAADAAALLLDERPSGGPGGYTLPQATADTLGGVKLGNGLSYNSQTGRVDAAGGGVATPSGAALVFTQDAEYGAITSGTFSVNPAGARPGVVVRVELGANATQPSLDPAIFELVGSGNYQAGKRLGYGFCVAASGKIEYVIYAKP